MSRLLRGALPAFLAAGLLAAGPPANAEPPTGSRPGQVAEQVAGATFTSVSPVRVLDTRTGPGRPVGPGATLDLDLSARVPSTATAVVLNVTGVAPTAPTHVAVFPAGVARPNTSSLNLVAGEVRANQVTVALGTGRAVSLYNNAGSAHLVVDLTGFYTPDYGASFVPLTPRRAFDTRDGTGTEGWSGPLGPGAEGRARLGSDLPATATGAVLNVTAVDATAATYVTVWGPYRSRSNASTLNVVPGATTPNAAVVALSAIPAVDLYNNAGSVQLVGDLTGVFAVVETPCTADCAYGWGDNDVHRKLGTGEMGLSRSTPAPVALSGVRAVYGGGGYNGYALRTDGTVWAWGGNEYGQLGNGWTAVATGGGGGDSVVPVPVLGLTGVTAVAAGDLGGYAVRSDGTVWAWGSGVSGRLGNGQDADSAVPVRVSGLTGVVAVASGRTSGYALRQDGTVWAWGDNGVGQLGTGSAFSQQLVPAEVDITGVTAIAAGDYTAFAVRSDGSAWAWGGNSYGQLGNGQPCGTTSTCGSRVPVQVSGLTEVTSLAAGWDAAYAVRADGSVYAWGSTVYGRLGNGVACDPSTTTCESRVPVRVSGLTGVTEVASFDFGGYALRADGTVWAWGFNGHQSLGNDDGYYGSPVPVRISGLSGVSAVAGDWYSGFAVVRVP